MKFGVLHHNRFFVCVIHRWFVSWSFFCFLVSLFVLFSNENLVSLQKHSNNNRNDNADISFWYAVALKIIENAIFIWLVSLAYQCSLYI